MAELAPKEKPGEVYLWREDFDFFKDAEPEHPPLSDEVTVEGFKMDGLDDFMTQVADCLGLGRGQRLVMEPEYEVIERREMELPMPSPHSCKIFVINVCEYSHGLMGAAWGKCYT